MCSKGFHEGGRGPIILPLPSSLAMYLAITLGRSRVRGHIGPGGPQGGSPLETNPKTPTETSNHVVSVRPVGMGHQHCLPDVRIKGHGHLHQLIYAMEVTRPGKNPWSTDLPCTSKDRPSLGAPTGRHTPRGGDHMHLTSPAYLSSLPCHALMLIRSNST